MRAVVAGKISLPIELDDRRKRDQLHAGDRAECRCQKCPFFERLDKRFRETAIRIELSACLVTAKKCSLHSTIPLSANFIGGEPNPCYVKGSNTHQAADGSAAEMLTGRRSECEFREMVRAPVRGCS